MIYLLSLLTDLWLSEICFELWLEWGVDLTPLNISHLLKKNDMSNKVNVRVTVHRDDLKYVNLLLKRSFMSIRATEVKDVISPPGVVRYRFAIIY
jgi:hypothetical protein